MNAPVLDVVIPAHNEARSITGTIEEFCRVVHVEQGLEITFVVAEDGSIDGTSDVLRELATRLPLRLLHSEHRKGYSRAVIDALAETTAPLVCFVDGDGQYDPADLPRLVGALGTNDLVVGFRAPRVDPAVRRVISRAFGFVYRRLFPVRLRDPSCPYLVMRRAALDRVLDGNPGILSEGFWWEFNARAAALGLTVVEAPVHHRRRAAGPTSIYTPRRLPAIAGRHLLGLVRLRRELAAARRS